MTLVRFQPFNDIDNLSNEIQKYFSDLTSFGVDNKFSPMIDISENDDNIYVEADIPGIKKEDLKLTLENNVLTIEGEKKKSEESNNKEYHKSERIYGSFKRSFTLPEEVDPDKVNAKFENGTLSITLEKLEKKSDKERTIELS